MKILWDKMRLQRVLNERTEEEELEQLWEMAVIRKQDSGLPANIFVDNSMSYRRGRHAMRIKFQPNKGDAALSRQFVSMTMDGDVMQNTIHHQTISLTSREIDMIRNFVYNNVEALEALSDMKISQGGFESIMISGGKAASPSEKEKLHKDLASLLRGGKYAMATLDFTSSKRYVEVVNWRVMDTKGYNKLIRRAVRNHGYDQDIEW